MVEGGTLVLTQLPSPSCPNWLSPQQRTPVESVTTTHTWSWPTANWVAPVMWDAEGGGGRPVGCSPQHRTPPRARTRAHANHAPTLTCDAPVSICSTAAAVSSVKPTVLPQHRTLPVVVVMTHTCVAPTVTWDTPVRASWLGGVDEAT